MMRPTILLIPGVALGLFACAKVGTLDQPAPLYGARAKAQYQAQKDAAARANKTQETAPEALPPDSSIPAQEPPRSSPVPGEPTSPSGSPPPGVLPNPYAEPQPPQ
jgi:hypothetical protein